MHVNSLALFPAETVWWGTMGWLGGEDEEGEGGGRVYERGGKRWICEAVFFQCEMYMYDIGCYFGLKTRLFKNVPTQLLWTHVFG